MGSVRFRGAIFENPGPAMRKACAQPLRELGTQIEATVKLNTPSRSGELMRSVSGPIVWKDNRGVSVKSNLKTKRKTWSERGTRGGVKLARAYRMWAKGKSKAREVNKQGLFAEKIARALE